METGIIIRAFIDERWESVDLGDERVTWEQMTEWLRSKGGFNPFAENLLLGILGKDQHAHEYPFIVDVGDATYESQGDTVRVACHDEGVTVFVGSGGDATSCDVPITDVRVYNGLIQLIRAIQVHYEEAVNPGVMGVVRHSGDN
jgi:hypothetical protein